MTSSSRKEYNFPGLAEGSILHDRRYDEDLEVVRIFRGGGPYGDTEIVILTDEKQSIGQSMRYKESRPLDRERFNVV